MDNFTINHYLKGITNEQWSNFCLIIKWFRKHNGYFSTNKPLIIEMFLDTHEKWKDDITPEEEETFWTHLVLWMIEDFLNVQPSDLELYKKAKGFYDSYKKINRLDPLAYRVLNYLVLIIGVAEKNWPILHYWKSSIIFKEYETTVL